MDLCRKAIGQKATRAVGMERRNRVGVNMTVLVMGVGHVECEE